MKLYVGHLKIIDCVDLVVFNAEFISSPCIAYLQDIRDNGYHQVGLFLGLRLKFVATKSLSSCKIHLTATATGPETPSKRPVNITNLSTIYPKSSASVFAGYHLVYLKLVGHFGTISIYCIHMCKLLPPSAEGKLKAG